MIRKNPTGILILCGLLMAAVFQNCGAYRGTQDDTSAQSQHEDQSGGRPPEEINSVFPTVPPGPPGSIDPTFGVSGKLELSIPQPMTVSGIKRDSVGRIYLFQSRMSQNRIAVYRLLPDGKVDVTFGTQGRLDIPASETFVQGELLLDDKLLLLTSTNATHRLRRYLSNGTPDSAYGTGGVATVQMPTHTPWCFRIFPDGRILMVLIARENVQPAWNARPVLFSSAGQIDTSFAPPEFPERMFGPLYGQYFADARIQPDGKIVMAFYLTPFNGNGDNGNEGIGLLRLNTNGNFDPSFGNAGLVTHRTALPFTTIETVNIFSDGSIVLAGYRGFSLSEWTPMLAKYSATGQLDPSFGTAGLSFPLPEVRTSARKFLISPRGKVVVAGYYSEFFQLNTNGTRVPGFGGKGYILRTELGLEEDMNELERFASEIIGELLVVCRSSRDQLKVRCIRVHL
ncbi:MAG: hypothetical protein K2X47_16600 [Bdellovibrionales bacterium]|nr:hypothetical protein [Bdellovibrionales bacterium]